MEISNFISCVSLKKLVSFQKFRTKYKKVTPVRRDDNNVEFFYPLIV